MFRPGQGERESDGNGGDHGFTSPRAVTPFACGQADADVAARETSKGLRISHMVNLLSDDEFLGYSVGARNSSSWTVPEGRRHLYITLAYLLFPT